MLWRFTAHALPILSSSADRDSTTATPCLTGYLRIHVPRRVIYILISL